MRIEKDLQKHKDWNKSVLKMYWIITIISLIVAGINYKYYPEETFQNYLITYMLLPTLYMILGILTHKIVYIFFPNIMDYYLSVVGIFLISVNIVINPELPILKAALLLPIMISVYYFQVKKLYFSVSIAMITFILLHYLFPELNSYTKQAEMNVMLVVFLVATIILRRIMFRGEEIINLSKELLKTKEALLEQNMKMQNVSKLDPLTQVYNHNAFHEYLEKMIEQAENDNISLQLGVFDIDNLKHINNVYSHLLGDFVIKKVADIIKENVSEKDMVFRYGGGQFYVIFVNKSVEEVNQIAEKIRLVVENTICEELNHRHITISIGIQNYVVGIGKNGLCNAAESSLFLAKRKGKNQVVIGKNIESLTQFSV